MKNKCSWQSPFKEKEFNSEKKMKKLNVTKPSANQAEHKPFSINLPAQISIKCQILFNLSVMDDWLHRDQMEQVEEEKNKSHY